jgi:hypothetical protein
MMPSQNGSAQIIKGIMTTFTQISLPLRMSFTKTTFVNVMGATMGTLDPGRPSDFTDNFITFSIIYQSVNTQNHHRLPVVVS